MKVFWIVFCVVALYLSGVLIFHAKLKARLGSPWNCPPVFYKRRNRIVAVLLWPFAVIWLLMRR